MDSLITNNVKRRRVTINSIVPNDMEKMFTTLANSDFLMKSKFLTRPLVQNIVIKYVETAKIEEPFTNSCETTCWWKKFIKFVESTNNLLKMHAEWKKLLYDDSDDVSTVLDSDEETFIDTSDEKLPTQTESIIMNQTLPTIKRPFSKMDNYDYKSFEQEESYDYKPFESYVYKPFDTGFVKRFEEKILKLRLEQQNKKSPPKIQVRLPAKSSVVLPQPQTVLPQPQTVLPQPQTMLPQPQIFTQPFTNTFFVDFCKYDFDCINEQCKRKHSPGVIPSRFNKMCRDGIYCKYIKCSYKH